MSKKILSIALAVVMLFSVMACTVGAANTTVTTTFPSNANQMGFRVVSDAYVGMPAGETVTVKVFWVHPVGTDYDTFLQSQGNVILCHTDAFTYDEGSRTWGEAYQGILKDSGNVNAKDNYSSTIIPSKLTATEQAYGWDRAMLVQVGVDAVNSGTTYAKGFNIDPTSEIFSITFTTTRDVTAADSFGIPETGLGTTTLASYSNGTKQVKITAANTIISEGYCPALVVANSDTATAKMRPGAAAGTVDLGIFGTVNAASFTPGKEKINGKWIAPNLNAVGVQARVNGVVAAGESKCIYDLGNGFNYAAAITGMTADAFASDTTIEVRTYITDVNGNTYFSNWIFIDAGTVHDNAVSNGMDSIA